MDPISVVVGSSHVQAAELVSELVVAAEEDVQDSSEEVGDEGVVRAWLELD